MLSPRIRFIAVFAAALVYTPQAWSGFLHSDDTTGGKATSTESLIKSLELLGAASSADTEASSTSSAVAQEDDDSESDSVDDDVSVGSDMNSVEDAAEKGESSESDTESFLQAKTVEASTGSDSDDDAVENSDQELDAVLKDGADAAIPDENLDADDAKIVYGSSENEEQLVEDLVAESDDSEDSEVDSTNSENSETESFLQAKTTTSTKGDEGAVENADQELDAVLKDGADAAMPDENLDADDAKIVYGSSDNEEQLVEDLEAQSDDSEDAEADSTNSEDSETDSFLQTKATTGAKGDEDAVENADQELDAVLKDGADAAMPDENLDADDAKIVYGSSDNEEQLVEDLEAQSDDSADAEADSTSSEDSETESLLQTKATTGAKGDEDAVENADQELDAVLKDGANAAMPDENLDAEDAKIVYGGSENEEQLVEDLEAQSDDSEDSDSESANSEDSEN